MVWLRLIGREEQIFKYLLIDATELSIANSHFLDLGEVFLFLLLFYPSFTLSCAFLYSFLSLLLSLLDSYFSFSFLLFLASRLCTISMLRGPFLHQGIDILRAP